MHRPAVALNPKAGSSQNAVASTPITAPRVLAAYRPATVPPLRVSLASQRASAGSVAPIAAVAGSSRTKVPAKATAHCRGALASAPVAASRASQAGASNQSSAAPQSPIASSQPAYQRAGLALRSMRLPSVQAPSAMPPKKAATTASTAADSCPSHSAPWRAQTI
jgi:hypothetical protein